ncbi:MAG: wax ester/triacylglycerol synthase family O-acyltransferase [Halioglobus sp.]
MQQLSAIDTLFVSGESENMPMHIGALSIYQSQTRQYFSRVTTVFEQRLGHSPIFRRKLVEPPFKLDNPYWMDDPDFVLGQHLHRVTLEAGLGEEGLNEVVADLHARGLDMGKPLWEAWVIDGMDKNGWPKGTYGVYVKVHHAAIDGVSGAEIIAALNDIEPRKVRRRKSKAHPVETGMSPLNMALQAARHNLGRPLRLANALRKMRNIPPPATEFNETPMHWTKASINQAVGSQRKIITVPLPFTDIRKIRRLIPSCTVNHVVLSIIGGALRKYLSQRGELPEFSLGAAVPINLRSSEDSTGGNIIGALLSSLGSTESDPVERLKLVRDSASGARKRSEAISRDVVGELTSGISRQASAAAVSLFQRVSRRPGGMPLPVHTIVSNIPGPPIPLYLGGDRLVDLRVYGLVFEPIGLFHTMISYDDSISLSVLACRNSLQEPERYRACLQDAFDAYMPYIDKR